MAENAPSERGQGDLSILGDPHHTRADLRMARRAVREDWPVPATTRPKVVARLEEIVETRAAMVTTKDGVQIPVVDPADKNAIAASRLLVDMTSKRMQDEHHLERLESGERSQIVRGATEVFKLLVQIRAGKKAAPGELSAAPADSRATP